VFLDSFTPEVRDALLALGDRLRLEPGTALVRRGDPGDEIYWVEDGLLEAVGEGGRHLSEIRAGEIVGDVAFVDGSPRSADVRAKDLSFVRRWTRASLSPLLADTPGLAADFYRAVAAQQAARVRHLSSPGRAEPALVALDGGTFHPDRGEIVRAEGPVRLTPVEVKLLLYLAARPGVTVTYRSLLADVWGYNDRVESRTVYTAIYRLRPKVEADPSNPRHLVAVPGVGYRFEP
jgi:CRP-like cAMP-binding protein